ncbi:ubiquitin homeostasis protein lub1 [Neofusicoccum parvum]|uniref:Ubiquitin homeostasis protein lub1 n=1 Tax=Neofusicoccum parvum TaxID=310453 RepID=A0ACB5S428_9PEZI|nr:ubiquitin homeostasis protein lub1 [Neofusicoccum parvum]
MPTQANPTAHRSIRAGLHKDRLNKDDKDFMVTDRILVPLYETLASYVRLPGDADKAPDYFRRFSPPPEWAIDRSRDGHKSYFGEDWGEAPRRIGRDPRFQPTFGQARFTLFEDKREEQLRGLGGERRSYQGGQSYNSGFPSAPGYQQF